jgi:type I restriction enzyme, S subunit
MKYERGEGWESVALGDVCDNHNARRIPVKQQDRNHGPYPYYGASGIVDHVDDFIFEGLHLLEA